MFFCAHCRRFKNMQGRQRDIILVARIRLKWRERTLDSDTYTNTRRTRQVTGPDSWTKQAPLLFVSEKKEIN